MIGSAPAGIGHLGIDVGIRWVWLLFEQCHCCQDLPRLAVATLRNIELLPRQLDRVRPVRRQSFDGGDLPPAGPTGLQQAGPHRLTIDQHSTRAALADAASVLRAGETDRIAEHPPERRLWCAIHPILDAMAEKSQRHIGPSVPLVTRRAIRLGLLLEGRSASLNAPFFAFVFYHLGPAASR